MPSSIALLAAALTLFTSTLAFSPDQCNATSYGRPDRAACNTLLTSIGKMGKGNTSYLFIPIQFPTPDGLSNGTRLNFPQTWSTTGCNASLVPIEEDGSSDLNDTSVTYDTSTYQDLATVGGDIVQQCISNRSRASGGWQLAGDNEALVLHLYAPGSEIERTIRQQTSTEIAATNEEEVEEAELDDPEYQDIESGLDDGSSNFTSSFSNDTAADGSTGTAAGGSGQPSTSNPATAASVAPPQTVQKSATFSYTGCEADNANSRTLSSKPWSGQNLTVERCAAFCSGYQYMGVEAGSECYCGGDANGKGVRPAKIVTTGATSCTTPCNGDETQVCGGTGWLSLYQNSLSASAGGTGSTGATA